LWFDNFVSNNAFFWFFAGLDSFLPARQRMAGAKTGEPEPVAVSFEENPSIKHMIEALGVPHTEVYSIRVNGSPVDFTYHIQDGDQVEVYPIQAGQGPTTGLNGLAGEPRFILDNHLGRLAAYLRMLGFDTLYRNDYQDEELSQVASLEGRILLTRDRRLLMRSVVSHGYCVQNLDPQRQFSEVVKRFALAEQIRPFQRCLRCNSILQLVSRDAVLHRLEPLTRQFYQEFSICPGCNQVYWKGSHYERMLDMIKNITGK
jgi:uncharacterized protein